MLLIVALLKDSRVLGEFIDLARAMNMDALVEVHNRKELETALEADAEIIGINNRNLQDFTEDIYTTVRLREFVPKDKFVVSESSIHTADDIAILARADINGVLVGESFMKSGNIAEKAAQFRRAYENGN